MNSENSFSSSEHITVLLHEAVNGLALKENGIYIDGTFGRGGILGLSFLNFPLMVV